MTGNSRKRPGQQERGSLPTRLLVLLLVGAVVASVLGGAVATAAAQESDAALSLRVEPAEPTAAPGGSVNLTLTVENTGTERSVGPVVQLGLPEGWAVVDQTSDNATYRSSTREWLWRGLDPGETGEATATVAVPEGADGGYELPVSADDAADATAETTATVAVGTSGGDPSDDGGGDGEGGDGDEGSDGAADGGGEVIGGGGDGIPLLLGAGVVAVAVVAGGALFWYRRR